MLSIHVRLLSRSTLFTIHSLRRGFSAICSKSLGVSYSLYSKGENYLGNFFFPNIQQGCRNLIAKAICGDTPWLLATADP